MTDATGYLRPTEVGEIMGWSVNTLACYRSNNRTDDTPGTDVDAGRSTTGDCPAHRRGDLIGVFNQFPITPQTLEQGMKRYIPKIGCHVTAARKEAFLLL